MDLSSIPLPSSPKRSLAAAAAAAAATAVVVDAAGQRARRLGVAARERLEGTTGCAGVAGCGPSWSARTC